MMLSILLSPNSGANRVILVSVFLNHVYDMICSWSLRLRDVSKEMTQDRVRHATYVDADGARAFLGAQSRPPLCCA
jgi:hypothetical protein